MAKYTFNVYIDESGDEGFKQVDGKWMSSRWFVLGAFITHKKSDLPLSKCVDQIKSDLKWDFNKPLHFLKFSHEKKRHVINCIANEGSTFRTCYIAVDKTKIFEETSLKQTKRYLYNYFTRYLLERVSWLVHAHGGEAHLIFENRANTSYEELNRYITDLIGTPEVQIRDGVFKSWKAVNKGQLKNIQLADAITTSLFKALEKDQFNWVEPSYMQTLKPFIYNNKGNYQGYGLKFFPDSINKPQLVEEFPWLIDFQKPGKSFTSSKILV